LRKGRYSLVSVCSEGNARLVDKNHRAYVFALKGNQADLHAEAKRVLEPLATSTAPDACSEYPLVVRRVREAEIPGRSLPDARPEPCSADPRPRRGRSSTHTGHTWTERSFA